MAGIYDIFFGYRRHDLNRAKPLLEALVSAGLRVWRDETAIDEGSSITQEIRLAIISSRLLMAWITFRHRSVTSKRISCHLTSPGWQR